MFNFTLEQIVAGLGMMAMIVGPFIWHLSKKRHNEKEHSEAMRREADKYDSGDDDFGAPFSMG